MNVGMCHGAAVTICVDQITFLYEMRNPEWHELLFQVVPMGSGAQWSGEVYDFKFFIQNLL